mmetsp:Transcript_5849/g.36264  ORF Transcript_5849/g.36264 Transcript_5849/m.36264 type:complete len:86 (+) Transcript_5849:2950-3207(+)
MTTSEGSRSFRLYGGFCYGESAETGYLNQLQLYNLKLSQWMWNDGTRISNTLALYETARTYLSNNFLGARTRMTTWDIRLTNGSS